MNVGAWERRSCTSKRRNSKFEAPFDGRSSTYIRAISGIWIRRATIQIKIKSAEAAYRCIHGPLGSKLQSRTDKGEASSTLSSKP